MKIGRTLTELAAEIERLQTEVADLKEHLRAARGARDAFEGDADSLTAEVARLKVELRLLRNHTSVNTHQIEIIDAALAAGGEK